MTDLHMILIGFGVVLLIGLAYIIHLRNSYYRAFIAGVPRRFYDETPVWSSSTTRREPVDPT